MKPAFSVVLLTTLIGAGQGLFLAFYSAGWLSLLGVLPAAESNLDGRAAVLSLGLLGAGLAASFFHLGHPERAWRAAAMWRTSWLSREVIALPAAMALIFAYVLLRLQGPDPLAFVLGAIEIRWSTLAGFGSLVLSGYPGLQSMGAVAFMGVGFSGLTSLTLLPVLLRRQLTRNSRNQ